MPNVPERRTSVKAEGGASRTRIEERFWTNTGLSLATRIVTAALSLATIPVVIDRLGLIDFGIWEALLAFASLAVILQTAVSGTLVWRISDAYGQGDAATIHRMTGLGVAASLGLFLLLWPPPALQLPPVLLLPVLFASGPVVQLLDFARSWLLHQCRQLRDQKEP